MEMEPDTTMATLLDPNGGALIAARLFEGDRDAVDKPPVVTFCWNQLAASKPDEARAYYTKVFGWNCDPEPVASNMWLFKAGDAPVAALMLAPPEVPTHWLAFVVVDDLAASREKAKKLGGKITIPAIAAPGMGQFGVIQDDQGATLALFEPLPEMR
jgi:predicted enzyme related to lactoylglutathione lyase